MFDLLKATIGFSLLSFWVWGTPVCLVLFIFGGMYIKSILLIALIYQYGFCKRSPTFYKFMKWLNTPYLVKNFETIWEDGQPK